VSDFPKLGTKKQISPMKINFMKEKVILKENVDLS
jgi:hypothetical protein